MLAHTVTLNNVPTLALFVLYAMVEGDTHIESSGIDWALTLFAEAITMKSISIRIAIALKNFLTDIFPPLLSISRVQFLSFF